MAHSQCLFELLVSLGVVHPGLGPDAVFELLEVALVSALRSVYVLLDAVRLRLVEIQTQQGAALQ